jgi:Vacuolar protein sorting-associated protein
MVDYLVKSLLKRYLGDFIENDLSVSMSLFSGQADLKDVSIKRDVFQKFGLPLEMIFGKIGHLKLKVPYASLSSNPVQALLEEVDIIVRPLTDEAQWEMDKLVKVQDLSSIEYALNSYVWTKYEELKKTQAERNADAKMNITYTEMIVDNIQVTLQNIHIRVENHCTKNVQALV